MILFPILSSLFLFSCQSEEKAKDVPDEFSASHDLPCSRPDPTCTSKLERDFTPFSAADVNSSNFAVLSALFYDPLRRFLPGNWTDPIDPGGDVGHFRFDVLIMDLPQPLKPPLILLAEAPPI